MPPEAAQVESVVESGGNVVPQTSNVSKFASLLKAENAENSTVPESLPNVELPPVKQPEKKPEAKADTIDKSAVRKAFEDGDLAKLAELLDTDLKSTKVKNEDWVKLRQSRRELNGREQQIQQAAQQVEQQRQQLQKTYSFMTSALPLLESGEYLEFLAKCSGKEPDALMEQMTHELVSPEKRTERKLRMELERDRAQSRARDEEFQRQQAAAKQAQEKAAYMQGMRAELSQDEDYAEWIADYGQEFLDACFYVMAQEWDGQSTLSASEAAERVIEMQEKKHSRFDARIQKRRERRGEQSAQTTSGKVSKNNSEQKGNQGARLSPRKPISNSQGGAGPAREVSRQEKNAFWANQLKRENAAH